MICDAEESDADFQGLENRVEDRVWSQSLELARMVTLSLSALTAF